MLGDCNTCGKFESAEPCRFCPTLICKNCLRNHESICELTAPAKRVQRGRTVIFADAEVEALAKVSEERSAVEDACQSPTKGDLNHQHDAACFGIVDAPENVEILDEAVNADIECDEYGQDENGGMTIFELHELGGEA